MLDLHPVGIHPEVVADTPLHVDGHIAQAQGTVPLVGQGLGHDAHGVGEVHHPGSGCSARRRLLGDLKDQGNGPKRLGQPARARWSPGRGSRSRPGASRRCGGRLWPPTRNWMITKSAPSIARCRSSVVTSFPAQPRRASIRSGQAADHLQAVAVRVEQYQLVDLDPVLVVAEAVHELGRVGAPASHHGHLGSHLVNVTSPCAPMRGEAVTGPWETDELILAVDGGASKTDVWLVTSGGLVPGAARGPGSNHQFSGLDGAMDALAETIAMAAADAGIGEGALPLARTGVYCLAGVDLPVDETRLTAPFGPAGGPRPTPCSMTRWRCLRAGVQSGWGVGVVCGSGLNCVGLGPDGAVVRFPSLGELSGDLAAGGSWLGVRALGLALRRVTDVVDPPL